MKYLNMAFLSAILVLSSVSASNALDINLPPNPVVIWKKYKKARATVKLLQSQKEALEGQLATTQEKLDEITSELNKRKGIIESNRVEMNNLRDENNELKVDIERIQLATEQRLLKFWAMYEPNDGKP